MSATPEVLRIRDLSRSVITQKAVIVSLRAELKQRMEP